MTDLALDLRVRIAWEFSLTTPAPFVERERSVDGTEKFLSASPTAATSKRCSSPTRNG